MNRPLALPSLAFRSVVTVGRNQVTNSRAVGTSGTDSVTNGQRWAVFAVSVALLAKALVDAASLADSNPAQARYVPFVLELTSAAFFIIILLPIWQASKLLLPPRMTWLRAVGILLALTIPVSVAHAIWLAVTRTAVFTALGVPYHFDWSWSQLLFEWRKDALSIIALAAIGWLIDRLFAPSPKVLSAPPFRLVVRDGSRTKLIAAEEINHASSAGNYVELATVHGRLLHRVTLEALAAELLPHGFVRIHRTHLVRIAAVAAIEATGSGDFSVTLTDGLKLPGSRRWRDALVLLGARQPNIV
jgi:LytTr DNA-binding domain